MYTVTLFQRVADEFVGKAREQKYIVRDFKWDEEQMKKEKKDFNDAGQSEKEQSATLQRLCKTNFGEVYSCWIHIKAIRVFVESILRYGLPPNSATMMIKIKPKQHKKVRDLLNSHFLHLDKRGGGAQDVLDDGLAALVGDRDYAPFVLFPVEVIE